MSDLKATPGPWSCRPDYKNHYKIDGPEWAEFASVVVRFNTHDEDTPIGVANAHVLAAARDLYEALDHWIFFIESEEGYAPSKPWVDKARAALAKARGEP